MRHFSPKNFWIPQKCPFWKLIESLHSFLCFSLVEKWLERRGIWASAWVMEAVYICSSISWLDNFFFFFFLFRSRFHKPNVDNKGLYEIFASQVWRVKSNGRGQVPWRCFSSKLKEVLMTVLLLWNIRLGCNIEWDCIIDLKLDLRLSKTSHFVLF